MKVTFTAATLADNTADPKLAGVIERLGGENVTQTEKAYGGANLVKYARGNVGGQFVFSVYCSCASLAAAAQLFKDAYNLLDTQGACVLDYSGTTLTFADAILHNVERVEWNGKGIRIRYTFEITTIA